MHVKASTYNDDLSDNIMEMAPKSAQRPKGLPNRDAGPTRLCHQLYHGVLKGEEKIRLTKKTNSSFKAYSQEMAATHKLISTKLTTLKPMCNDALQLTAKVAPKWLRDTDADEACSRSTTKDWLTAQSTKISINKSTNNNKKYYNKLTHMNANELCVVVKAHDRQQQTQLRQHLSFTVKRIILEVVLMLGIMLSKQPTSHQHHRLHQRQRHKPRQPSAYGWLKLCHRCRPAVRVLILMHVAATILHLAHCNGSAGSSSRDDAVANVSGEQHGSSSAIEGLSLALGVELKDGNAETTQEQDDVEVSTLTMLDTRIHAHSSHAQNGTKRKVHQSSVLILLNRDNVLEQYNNNKVETADGDSTTIRAGRSVPGGTDSTAADSTVETTTAMPDTYTTNRYSSCPSCHMREKAKHDNLESIKTNILMRLQLKKLPNVTVPRVVPNNILEHFYKNFNGSNHRLNPETKTESYGGIVILGEEGEKKLQNDDPFAHKPTKRDNDSSDDYYINDGQQFDYDDEEDDYDTHNEDEFFSRVNSVYVFPTMSRIRHNRRPEILNFKFDNTQATISRAIMHIFIRGVDWIRENEPGLLEQRSSNGTIEERNEIVITVHRAVRRPNAVNYTHTVRLTETKHSIPTGAGRWVEIELKPLAEHWRDNLDATQGLVIKGQETWMRPLIVTGDNAQSKPFSVHIEVLTKEKRRRKRSTSLDCQESDHEVRCCRYPLKVNFTSFGWHFVVAPTSFDAYFCNGECRLGYLEQYTHTHITSLTPSATPCCTPTKLSSLSLLYFDGEQNLVFSTIPNMSVEKCSCS